MKSTIIIVLLAVILITGTITPALAQTSNISSNIVINEIELNPPGTDSRSTNIASSSINEFLELYNPTDLSIDVSGWQIIPAKVWKSYTIPSGTIIQPNDHAVFMASSFWFSDVSEFVTLKDADGVIIDQTPLLDDTGDDMSSWQRIYDGWDTDNNSDWILKGATGAATNGQYIAEDISDDITINLEIDKEQYDFGEKVNITGSVSEQSFNTSEYSSTTLIPELITIFISGPSSYRDTITLYPDLNLQFSTSLNLHKVLGYAEGFYLITASYSTDTATTNFSIGAIDESVIVDEVSSELTIVTDQAEYQPGQWVGITATTTNSLDYVGLKYTVSNSKGSVVSTGTIFPNVDNEFTTNYFIPVSTDVFGEYKIFANYQFTTQFSNSQTTQSTDSQAAITSFSVLEDIKESELISVSTDKSVYGLGEIIHITGRSNSIHVDTFNVHVQQTGIQTAFSGNDAAARADPLNYHEIVRLDGNSKFELDLKLPAIDARLGNYKITAGENFGHGYGYFKVVENPDTFVESESTPLGLETDKTRYALNDKITISGLIEDFSQSEADKIAFQQVQIQFKDPTGHTLKHSVHTSSNTDQYEEQLFLFTSIPDQVGFFRNQLTLDSVTFDTGIYTIKVHYKDIHDSIKFEIVSDEAIALESMEEESQEPVITINVDKDLYEVGDTVSVTGKVLSRELISERSQVEKWEEQGKDDHFRPKVGTHVDYTNYALNFVKVKIPYPVTLYSSQNSAYTTTTLDGSLPSGGCGPSSGNECVGTGSYDGVATYNEIVQKLEPFESPV